MLNAIFENEFYQTLNSGVAVPFRDSSMGQIDLFKIYSYLIGKKFF